MNTQASFLTEIVCKYQHDPSTKTDYFWDDICGTYSITNNASRELNENIENKRKIANVLAQRKCRGFETPIKITLDRSGNEDDWVLETINNLVSQYPASPIEIFDEALVNLSYLIKHPSETITIPRNEAWQLYSYDFVSASYILRQSEELQYIKSFDTISSKDITIEAKGWEKLSELRRSLSKDKKTSFCSNVV